MITTRSLENFRAGYTDGFDDGVYGGLVVGHEQGWHDGQNRVIEILDANGFIVYSGEFTPASYVKETFSDKAGMRIGGVGLAAAGALIAVVLAGQSGAQPGSRLRAWRRRAGRRIVRVLAPSALVQPIAPEPFFCDGDPYPHQFS